MTEADLAQMSPAALIAWLKGRPLPDEGSRYHLEDSDDDAAETADLEILSPPALLRALRGTTR